MKQRGPRCEGGDGGAKMTRSAVFGGHGRAETPIGHHVPMVQDLGPPPQSGISHFGLSVTDLDRSVAFYCDVLGARLIRPPYAGESPSFFGRMALVMVGSTPLDLYQHTDNNGDRFEPARTGLDHFALVADSYEDLEAWRRWLEDRGVQKSEIRAAGGAGAIFDFVDPDGIQIEFLFLDRGKLRQSPVYATDTTSRGGG